MLLRTLIILSKENEYGYFLDRSELPPHILRLLEQKEGDRSIDKQEEKHSPNNKIPIYQPITRINDVTKGYKLDLSIDSLIKKIRPQQRSVFIALHNILKESEHQEIQEAIQFSVDLPLKEGGSYYLVRCFFSQDNESIYAVTLNKTELYKGQPFFPRLIYIDNTIARIPNHIRREIYHQYLLLKESPKCRLDDRPRLMLRVSYTRNDMSYSQIRLHMEQGKKLAGETIRIGEEAIKASFKKFTRVAKELFAVNFSSRKHVANYWVEMGFNLEPIPELNY